MTQPAGVLHQAPPSKAAAFETCHDQLEQRFPDAERHAESPAAQSSPEGDRAIG